MEVKNGEFDFSKPLQRISSKLRVQVENPHTWLQEETEMNKNQIRERDIEECQHREAKFREVLDK
ncbi:MAG: hypothetical protein OXD49_09475, partial [Candidatus Poribacteria bacterium]|nr:hypothetical protein [Candidatus Poribacteria bacterium]